MKYKIYIPLLLLVILLFACKKDVCDTPSVKTENVDPTKSFLNDVRSDPASDYYISGEFDGHKIYCASTLGDMFPYHDTVFNALYFNSAIDLDNIHLIRENRDMTVMLSIYFDKAKIFTRQFPYVVPRTNMDKCESVEIELMNRKKLGTTGQNAPNDDFGFRGYTNTSVKVQVDSFVDNIMQGTFEGELRTNTGSVIQVKNGSFRIKIIDYYKAAQK
jgi:hypothetical protein